MGRGFPGPSCSSQALGGPTPRERAPRLRSCATLTSPPKSGIATRAPRQPLVHKAAETGRVVAVGIVTAAAMVALLAAVQSIDFGMLDLRINWLNADHRLSVFAIASLLAQAAAGAAGIWRGVRQETNRRAWLTLGVLLGSLVLIRGLTAYNRYVLAVPLACVFGMLFWLTWRDPSPARAVLWIALAALGISLLLHEVGPDADASTASDYTWTYQIVGIVKHGAELAGWTLAATAIAAGAVARAARPTAAARAVTGNRDASTAESLGRSAGTGTPARSRALP